MGKGKYQSVSAAVPTCVWKDCSCASMCPMCSCISTKVSSSTLASWM
jgi:hypothetical protein